MTPDNAPYHPVPSVRRLPLYLGLLRQLHAEGRAEVACTFIAKHLGLGNVQVRKDLAMTGIVGRPKIGYSVPKLIDAIESFLGWKDANNALLVGVGGLGSAILGYKDFRCHGLNIVAAFDTDPGKIGRSVHDVKVLSLDDLAASAHKSNARIGIITVPAAAAQDVANRLVRAGIQAIWNFSPATLDVPSVVIVENVRFVDSLAVLSQRLHQRTRIQGSGDLGGEGSECQSRTSPNP